MALFRWAPKFENQRENIRGSGSDHFWFCNPRVSLRSTRGYIPSPASRRHVATRHAASESRLYVWKCPKSRPASRARALEFGHF